MDEARQVSRSDCASEKCRVTRAKLWWIVYITVSATLMFVLLIFNIPYRYIFNFPYLQYTRPSATKKWICSRTAQCQRRYFDYSGSILCLSPQTWYVTMIGLKFGIKRLIETHARYTDWRYFQWSCVGYPTLPYFYKFWVAFHIVVTDGYRDFAFLWSTGKISFPQVCSRHVT